MGVTKSKLLLGDNVTVLRKFPRNSVDLTVTSPPYDQLRDYNGYSWDFEGVANQLYRVTKEGGVVVWVVGDSTVNGSETLTSFKQALYFASIGFNVHDTMIWEKSGMSNPSVNRCHQIFEYMFIFSKGKPKTFNALMDRPNKYVGTMGANNVGAKCKRGEFGARFNIWYYPNGKNQTARHDSVAFKHPAPFPEALAGDHIKCWSNKNDIVLDPFMGSGTTGLMALRNDRKFVGIELSVEYYNMSKMRIQCAKRGKLW